MAVTATKSSGRYFHDFERVWTETRDTGVSPFWVGPRPFTWNLPAQPNPHIIQSLADGRQYLNRVQANRVGCFDLTVSMSKGLSTLAYGLTPPGEWKKWTEAFVKVAAPEIEKLVSNQKINSGPQGKNKEASQGVAVGFAHWKSYLGKPHGHIHFAVPNVSAGDRKNGSIANAHEMYEKQGVMNARIQKGLDDVLQARGIETVRVGKKVEPAGMPKEMLEELSPGKQAMNEAKAQKGFDGAKAQDFYARQARRDLGPRVDMTPQEMHRDVTEVAARHGVTLESLTKKGGPAADRSPATEMSTAYQVAKEAAAKCSKKHGAFTAEQFQEKLFTLGIGKPTTLEALDAMGKAALKDRTIVGIKVERMKDGTERYSTKESAKVERAAERPYQPDTKEAWEALKTTAKGLGTAVFLKTAAKAKEVTERLTDAVKGEPKIYRVDSSRLPAMIDAYKPTHYLKAHAKAIFSGIVRGSGNPHERAGHAEQVYKQLRSHERLPKGAVIVVERGSLAGARDLQRLAKIARRDKASVVLSERDPERLSRMQEKSQDAKLNRDRHGL